jgi:hypothetical protein
MGKFAAPRFFLRMIWLLCLNTAFGQHVAFNHVTVEDGLLNNSVLAITQDATGFLWFGTRIGLNRYNGSRFQTYKTNTKHSTSISDNNITALFVDRSQTLWVGNSAGLDQYLPRIDAFERVKTKGTSTGTVYCIYEDSKGNRWVGGSNGLFQLSGHQKKELHLFKIEGSNFAGAAVRAIVDDLTDTTAPVESFAKTYLNSTGSGCSAGRNGS